MTDDIFDDENIDLIEENYERHKSADLAVYGKTLKKKHKPDYVPTWSSLKNDVNDIYEFMRKMQCKSKSFAEFFNPFHFKQLSPVEQLDERLRKNIAYFQANYIFILVISLAYYLYYTPGAIIIICALAFACYQVQERNLKIVLFPVTMNSDQICLCILMISGPILLMQRVRYIFIHAMSLAIFLCSSHAAFYDLDAVTCGRDVNFLK